MTMTLTFSLLAILIIAAAVAAMSLRNLIHCALAMVGAFGGLALLYLELNAQFVGLAQVLVYIGAVSILIVFAVLLTRGGETPEKSLFSSSWVWGGGIALAVFAVLAWAVNHSFVTENKALPQAETTVKGIGDALMTQFILPLEVLGLLLTAAMIGAVIIALRDNPTGPGAGETDSNNPSAILHLPSSSHAEDHP